MRTGYSEDRGGEVLTSDPSAEPYRYDERATSTGSSQADLAPVSPEPASSQASEPERVTDPMGAAADAESSPVEPDPPTEATVVEAVDGFTDTQSSAPGANTTALTSLPMPAQPPSFEEAGVNRGAQQIDIDAQASPETTISWQDFSGVSHQTTISMDVNLKVSADVMRETDGASMPQALSEPAWAPSMPQALSEPAWAPSMPQALPESAWVPSVVAPTAADMAFADMAARLDQMMADLTDLGRDRDDAMPFGPGDGLIIGSANEGGFITALDDFRAAADALVLDAEPLFSPPSGSLLGSVFAPDMGAESPFEGSPLSTDLFDADQAITELFATLDDDIELLSGLGRDGSGDSAWDHFNDFG